MAEHDEGPTPDRPTIDPRAYANVARESASSSGGRSPDTTRLIEKRPGIPRERFGFDIALVYLRDGLRVARTGWNGPGQYIQLQVPRPDSRMTLPYLSIHTAQGETVPWLASQTDLLAWDWCLVTERTVLVYGARPPEGKF